MLHCSPTPSSCRRAAPPLPLLDLKLDPMTDLMFFDDSSLYSSFESKCAMMEAKEDELILMVAEWIASTGRKRKHSGSQVGHATFRRNRFDGHERLIPDYFCVGLYLPVVRVPLTLLCDRLFRRIANNMHDSEPFFQERRNVVSLSGFYFFESFSENGRGTLNACIWLSCRFIE